MPECEEDQVLIGQGDFESGTWTYYTCGPAVDDFVTPQTHNAETQVQDQPLIVVFILIAAYLYARVRARKESY